MRSIALVLCVGNLVVLTDCGRRTPNPAGNTFPSQAQDSTSEAIPQRPPAIRIVKVFFDGGLRAEGGDALNDAGDWVVQSGHRVFRLHLGTPPYFEIDLDETDDMPREVRVDRRGWHGASVALPPASAGGSVFVETPIFLNRQTCTIALKSPRGETDYDLAELVWKRPLSDQPLASRPSSPIQLPLHFTGMAPLPPAPTGVYDLQLKSLTPSHARPFVIARDLVLSGESQNGGYDQKRAFALPRSLQGAYVGFADSWLDPNSRNSVIGAFLGLRLDWKAKEGELMVVNVRMADKEKFQFGDLRPSPDGVWPISNLQLIDPVTMEFDCPMSFADHHFTLVAADGVVTLKTEFSPPESEAFKIDMFTRMKGIFREQGRNLQKDPNAFDPAFRNTPAHELPSFGTIANPQNFTDHLARLSRTKISIIELGRTVEVRVSEGIRLDVHVEPAP